MTKYIVSIVAMSIVVMVASTFVQEAKANGAACQLYGHSCLGGHGKRSSSQSNGLDSDSAVDAAATAAFQAKMTANRMNSVLREMIARRMVASAAERMSNGFGDESMDIQK